MSHSFSRRDLLKTAAALPMATLIDPSKARAGDAGEQAAAGQATSAVPPVRIKRAVLVSMLPEKLSWKERFALAKDIGFDGIEMQTMEDQAATAEVARASQETGLVIHSVMNIDHWRYPISSPDPEVVRQERRRHEDLAHQRGALEGGDRAAGAGRREPGDVVCRRLGALDAGDPRAARAAGGRLQGQDRHRGGLEQVPPRARWNSPATSTSSNRRGSRPTSTSATSSCTAIRRTGSARSASASRVCT